MAVNDHRGRIPGQDHVDSSIVDLFGNRVIVGGIGVITFGWMLKNLDNDIWGLLVAILSALLASALISFVLGIILKPFDVNKKYRFWGSFLISVCIFLAISFPAITVSWIRASQSASSATEGIESMMMALICLFPLATISALMLGLSTAIFSRLGFKLRNKS